MEGCSQQSGRPTQFLAALAAAALVEHGGTAKQLEPAVEGCSQQPGRHAQFLEDLVVAALAEPGGNQLKQLELDVRGSTQQSGGLAEP